VTNYYPTPDNRNLKLNTQKAEDMIDTFRKHLSADSLGVGIGIAFGIDQVVHPKG